MTARTATTLAQAVTVDPLPPGYLDYSGRSDVLSGGVKDLGKIAVPALMIGAKYDTMDPEVMKKMAGLVKRGRFLYCENGSHLAIFDDQKTYFDGLIRFIRDVDAKKF